VFGERDGILFVCSLCRLAFSIQPEKYTQGPDIEVYLIISQEYIATWIVS
jgi:hypothetical protein